MDASFETSGPLEEDGFILITMVRWVGENCEIEVFPQGRPVKGDNYVKVWVVPPIPPPAGLLVHAGMVDLADSER